MNVHTLDAKFTEHYGITGFHKDQVNGGQKMVYFPIIKGEAIVLKFFPAGYDERIQREMEIYEKFKDLDGIPKVRSIENYGKNTIVFEEFINGETLSDIMNRYHNNPELVKDIIRKCYSIMSPIWESGLIHRDIKPLNIIVREGNNPVIIDFGIARDLGASSLTASGWQPMSWQFAAPEQYKGEKSLISYRTDFFSLAALGYQLFHNSHPFGNTLEELEKRYQTKDEKYEMHENFPIKDFCSRTLKFSPSERTRNIGDLFKCLE